MKRPVTRAPASAWRPPAAAGSDGRRPMVNDDEHAAILARRRHGEPIRAIAAGVKVSAGVVHRT
jgi:hypothetical protein